MNEISGFGQRLKEQRTKKGLNQKELSSICGVSTQTISGYEKGGKLPTIDNAARLAKALGVSLDWLAGIDTPQPAQTHKPIRTLGDVAREIVRIHSYEQFDVSIEEEENAEYGAVVEIGTLCFHHPQFIQFLKNWTAVEKLFRESPMEPNLYNGFMDSLYKNLDTVRYEDDELPF